MRFNIPTAPAAIALVCIVLAICRWITTPSILKVGMERDAALSALVQVEAVGSSMAAMILSGTALPRSVFRSANLAW